MSSKNEFSGDVGQAVFGNVNMSAFPGDQYREAVDLLDARIAILKNLLTLAADAVPVIQSQPETIPCMACTPCTAETKWMRTTIRWLCATLLCLVLLCGWLLMHPTANAAPAYSAETHCLVDGKAYSLGSSSRMPDGTIRECSNNGHDAAPRWSLKDKK